MKRIGIIFQRDLRELRQTIAFLAIVIIFSVVTIATVLIISIVLSRHKWLMEIPARPILGMIISLIAYFLPLFILITFIWAFASLPIIKEKVNGNIASLLATPLSPGEIWIGKSFAIFLPGLIISTVSTLIVLFAINLIVIKPAVGIFVLPVPALVTGFLINPLLFLGLLLIIILLNLANNPDLAIAPSFIVGFSLMMGIPLGVATGKINLASWSFSLWYLGGAMIIWVIICFLLRLLTKENIIFSSQGE